MNGKTNSKAPACIKKTNGHIDHNGEKPVKGLGKQGGISKTSAQTFRVACKVVWHIGVAVSAYFAYLSIATVSPLCLDLYKSGKLAELWSSTLSFQLETQTLAVATGVIALLGLLLWRRSALRNNVYLLDFACYKPPEEMQVTWERFMRGSKNSKRFNQESLEFQERIGNNNGLGQGTYLPTCLHMEPPEINMDNAREEASLVLFGAVAEALEKTGLKASQIDVLVVNCSLFNPTPSLSAMIINHFKMRSDIISYNLAGMGCSAGVIAVGLAQRLLREEPGRLALVVSTENITQNWYFGDDRSMLIPNTLLRMGAAAMLLTNKPSLVGRCKYKLEHIVRVHLGADDDAYKCVYQYPDDTGTIGVSLSRDLVKVAGRAMEKNLTRLGPLVLPLSEKLLFVIGWLRAKATGRKSERYIPDFKQAFNHFCIHAGGRGVIDGIGGQLGLSEKELQPSRATLFHYGNTSSSSIWYSLAYIEACQTVRRGDRVWQIGFGSGFKCNSAVWTAMKKIQVDHTAWNHITDGSFDAANPKKPEI